MSAIATAAALTSVTLKIVRVETSIKSCHPPRVDILSPIFQSYSTQNMAVSGAALTISDAEAEVSEADVDAEAQLDRRPLLYVMVI